MLISAEAEHQTWAEKAVCCGVSCYFKWQKLTQKASCIRSGGEYLSCLYYILQYSFRQLNNRLGQSQNSRDKLSNSPLERQQSGIGLVENDFILSETTLLADSEQERILQSRTLGRWIDIAYYSTYTWMLVFKTLNPL